MPGCSGEPVVTTSCAFLFCTRDCGCSAHPAFPAPSILSRVVVVRKTRALSAPRDRGGVAVRELTRKSAVVMAGLVPRLSGSIFVDKAHGVDSSVLQAFGDVLGHGEGSSHAASQ